MKDKRLLHQPMLVNAIALREAKASTEIEDIFTTDDDLYKAISGNESSLDSNAKQDGRVNARAPKPKANR